MEASHYAYNTLKMPGLMGAISIPSDKKDVIICVDKMYREVVVEEVAEATAPPKESKKKKKASKDANKESGKHTSPECAAPVDDLPESSIARDPRLLHQL